MTAKQYLERAERYKRKINMLLEQIESARQTAYVKSVNYDSTGASHGSSDSSVDGVIPKAIASVDEYEKKLKKAQSDYYKVVVEIECMIDDNISNLNVSEAMHRRYLMFQPITGTYSENGSYTIGICDSMQKSKRQVYQYLDDGTEIIKNILIAQSRTK